MGDVAGWVSMGLGQLVAWPWVLKLKCDRGDNFALPSFIIVLASMSLAWVHALAIGDAVVIVAVPLSLVPNLLVAATILHRRRTGAPPRAALRGACGPVLVSSSSGNHDRKP